MANPTKIDPRWKLDAELIREINRTAPKYNEKPDAFAETCLYEQIAIRAKDLDINVRLHYVKVGVYMDLRNLANTLNVPVQGNLKDVFSAVIALSSLHGSTKIGRESEQNYLESVYKHLLKLKSVDMVLYEDIIRSMDKKSRKWKFFQECIAKKDSSTV